MQNKLTRTDKIENALREIAAHAAAKGGEWASQQAFSMLEFIEHDDDRERTATARAGAELIDVQRGTQRS